MTATTMTATGEVTIPESVRAAAGLVPGTPLEVSAAAGGILIKRAKKRRPLTREQIEAVAGTATIKWRSTDEFMAFVRGDDD